MEIYESRYFVFEVLQTDINRVGEFFPVRSDGFFIYFLYFFSKNNSDYLQKARKYGHFTGYKN
ncbi:hypothetical protein BEI62_21130 [Eisenbergiella tayi]|nr:hypothetical protein BEI62_21130 [Eisenbergiella tayi]